MKKPKKQKKPSYKSLVFDLSVVRESATRFANANQTLRADLQSANETIEQLERELDDARTARENKMKQLGLYFAALDSLPCGHERLIQLQDELFDRNTGCGMTGHSFQHVDRLPDL